MNHENLPSTSKSCAIVLPTVVKSFDSNNYCSTSTNIKHQPFIPQNINLKSCSLLEKENGKFLLYKVLLLKVKFI